MKLAKRTTEISVHRTVAQIEALLQDAGVEVVAKSYDEDRVLAGLAFQINGTRYRLEADPAAAFRVMRSERKRLTKPGEDALRDQAERTAWRVWLMWLEAQLSLLEIEQSTLEKILLPFRLVSGNRTVFEHLEEHGFNMPALLPAPDDGPP